VSSEMGAEEARLETTQAIQSNEDAENTDRNQSRVAGDI
jgi:hypothetical protein